MQRPEASYVLTKGKRSMDAWMGGDDLPIDERSERHVHTPDDDEFAEQYREYLEMLAKTERASPLDPLRPADDPGHLQR